jgi:DNA modification methylase
MTATAVQPIDQHPAKFSPSIMAAILDELRSNLIGPAHVICDPFAGIGRVHEIADEIGANSVGVEIEPEWAATHPRTLCGDSTVLSEALGDRVPVDVIVTSPAYGNRFADQYLGSDNETCRECGGAGEITVGDGDDEGAGAHQEHCPKCGGTGRARSTRRGYAISLGRRCTDGSGAAIAWGDRYRDLHRRIWTACDQVLAPGGLWLVNVSSFLKTVDGDLRYQAVAEWHLEQIAKLARVDRMVAIPTARMRHGQNSDARVHVEHLIVARKPT